MAVNCTTVPRATELSGGVTAIETNVAGVTVNVDDPKMVPMVAEITDVPAATPLARPVPLTVATPGVADAQINPARMVMSTTVSSEYVPIAVNWAVVPTAAEGSVGVTAIAVNDTFATVSAAVAVKPS